jgi:hypothetical protein
MAVRASLRIDPVLWDGYDEWPSTPRSLQACRSGGVKAAMVS